MEQKYLSDAHTLMLQDRQQIQELEEKFPKFKSLHPEILQRVEVVLVDIKEQLLLEKKGLFGNLVRKMAAWKKNADTKLQILEDKIYNQLQDFLEQIYKCVTHNTRCSANVDEVSFVQEFVETSTDEIYIKLKTFIDRVYVLIKDSLHVNDPSIRESPFSDLISAGTATKEAITVAIDNSRKIGNLVKSIVNMVKVGLAEAAEAAKTTSWIDTISIASTKIFRFALAGRIIAIALQTAMGFFALVGLAIDVGCLVSLLYQLGTGSISSNAEKVQDSAYRLEIENVMWHKALGGMPAPVDVD